MSNTAAYDPKYFSMLAQSFKARGETQNQQQKAVIHTLLSSREIELLIREFNPTKNRDLYASEWIREIELLGGIHKWDSCHLLLYSTMRLQGVAKTWYEYSMDSIGNWNEFKVELINNFPRTIDSADIHTKLIAKKRQPQESVEEYFHTTVRMAKRIKLPDDAIKDYLIRGLQEPRHQVLLSSIGPCSLTEFLQHMLRLDADAKQNEKGTKRSYTEQSRSEQPADDAKRVLRCYVCNMYTHSAAQCPRKAGGSKRENMDGRRSGATQDDYNGIDIDAEMDDPILNQEIDEVLDLAFM